MSGLNRYDGYTIKTFRNTPDSNSIVDNYVNTIWEYAGYRNYYMEYITRSIINHGLIPFYWDSGYTGDKGSGIFDRLTGAAAHPDIIKLLLRLSYQISVETGHALSLPKTVDILKS